MGALLVAGLLMGAAGIVAAETSTTDPIKACHDTKTGAMRYLYEGASACTSKEQAISWSQEGPQGPAGPAGPAGPQGPQGSEGPPGVSGYEVIETYEWVPPLEIRIAEVRCPSDKKVLGGGAWADPFSEMSLNSSAPLKARPEAPADGGWIADAYNSHEYSTSLLYVYAICANV